MRILKVVTIIVGLALAAYLVLEKRHSSVAESLTVVWNKDLTYLKKLKGFPQNNEIKEIHFTTSSHLSRTWLLQSMPDLKAEGGDKGKYILDITMDAWIDSKEKALLIQYELLSASTKNKLWEFARTFYF